VRTPSGVRIAFSYPADMSIETAWIEAFCSSASLSKEGLQAGGVTARRPHTIRGFSWSGHTGQELVLGTVADLVHADQSQAVQPALVELVGHDPLEDVTDRLPPIRISLVTCVWLICCANHA